MTKTVNIAEAKAKLSALIDAAAAGEEIVLARAGKPVARLVPIRQERPLGLARHWNIPDDAILEPLPEDEQRALEGEDTDELGITLPHARFWEKR